IKKFTTSENQENTEFDLKMVIPRIEKDLGLDKEIIDQLLEEFFEQTKTDLDKLGVAIEKSDFEQVDQIAHSIKGASANLCLDKISELAKELEFMGKNKDLTNAKETFETLASITSKFAN
ncbi:MAG: Hpt domain-containing protein, partial [bacterium]|nr:Hpt domain-containing protein [bacterium]